MDPRLTTPIFVQQELAAESSHCPPNNVFALHHDESPSLEVLSSPPHSPDGTALNIYIFRPRSDDEQPGISQNDQAFLDIMHQGVKVTSDCYIQLPLPFKHSKCPLSNNSNAVYGRTHNTLVNLAKHEWKITQSIPAMQHNINEGYVEQVPESSPRTQSWVSLVHPSLPCGTRKEIKDPACF